MKYIDLENWNRRGHYEFFHKMDYPQFNICMDIDISNFISFAKQNGLSFYYSMVYASTTIINRIENFKYRIRDDKVVLHDKIHPSFTDMSNAESNDLFKMVTVDLSDDIHDFVKIARQTSENQKDYFVPEKLMGRDDLIYITCIPWISFTHISHTISLNKNDSVPRISWGKYYKQGKRTLLPFSVQANHSLIDGYHVGKYIDKLQTFIDEIK
ncbi:CatA-like O-acetyltransferase [Saccharicrinis sp. FJH2]|uniref:CatA-like O-acetyltransferase n=1 Tax=Saccharicrinis sp. FJH65 TaxID=3344659 RepID=UPI0035F48118